MELIVLGSSAAYPSFGKACSGYLLREDKTQILVDCGTGVLSNLFKWADPAALNAIILTHLHTDHFLDIYPLRYYLQYQAKIDSPILVLAPEGGKEHVLQLVNEKRKSVFTEFFEFDSICEGMNINIGAFEFDFFMVPHAGETFALSATGEKKVMFSADCGLGAKSILKNAAFGADLLVCEATLQDRSVSLEKVHLTAEQAGEIAEEAEVKKLMLSHIWSGLNSQVSISQAEKVFGGQVILAVENLKLEM